MSNTTSYNPSRSARALLLQIIVDSFELEEIRTLCFKLGVDFDELPRSGKTPAVRELIIKLKNQQRLPELVQLVQELRPSIDLAAINLQQITRERLADDPRLESVNSLMTVFRDNIEALYEWKELHNHLDETLNIFGQYAAQVERFAPKGSAQDLDLLRQSWQPVSRRVEVMLHWAGNEMHQIGKPFRILPDGSKEGESWAVELSELQQAVIGYLQATPPESGDGFWARLTPAKEEAARSWWRGLLDLTRTMDNKLKTNMFIVDKDLRQSAASLYDLSKEYLWS